MHRRHQRIDARSRAVKESSIPMFRIARRSPYISDVIGSCVIERHCTLIAPHRCNVRAMFDRPTTCADVDCIDIRIARGNGWCARDLHRRAHGPSHQAADEKRAPMAPFPISDCRPADRGHLRRVGHRAGRPDADRHQAGHPADLPGADRRQRDADYAADRRRD